MDETLSSLLDESINLELRVAKLYTRFHALFPEDAHFWWALLLEEKNHAALFRSGKEHFCRLDTFPPNLLIDSLRDLKKINTRLAALIERFADTPPTREEAFSLAFDIENSAAELHFQEFMEAESCVPVEEIFRQLNKGDKDHAERIKRYMTRHGIPLHESLFSQADVPV